MAKVTLASYFTEMSGRLGNYVFYNSYDMEYVRSYVIPQNPDTDAQKAVRKTFGDAVRSWQSLTFEEHLKYNKKARRLQLSGYNLYISIYIKERFSHSDLKKENKALSIAFRRHSDSTQIAGSSVPSPFFFKEGTLSPYIKAFPCSLAG